jgi:hypothetical protein
MVLHRTVKKLKTVNVYKHEMLYWYGDDMSFLLSILEYK